jgi:hypothetical protein
MRRPIALGCALICALALAAHGFADRRTGVDTDAGIRFTLDGSSLKAAVIPGETAERVRKKLFGNLIDATCSTTYAPRPTAAGDYTTAT